MSFEMMVALHVTNDEVYSEYRNSMRPLLEKYGGGFRYDFTIEKVLKTESDHPINRVFAIYFGDEEQMNAFFTNPEYKAVKEKYFERSVSGRTIISQYVRQA